jgi:hypothetical protein
MRIRRFMACPIMNKRKQLLGAAFVSWDVGDPEPPSMSNVEITMRSLAAQLAEDVGDMQ